MSNEVISDQEARIRNAQINMANNPTPKPKTVVDKIKHIPYVIYSPYVDDFQYYCECSALKQTQHKKYTNTRKITFWTDKNGDVILLDIEQLCDGAKEIL